MELARPAQSFAHKRFWNFQIEMVVKVARFQEGNSEDYLGKVGNDYADFLKDVNRVVLLDYLLLLLLL